MTTDLPPAYFLRDGADFVPTDISRGPWGSFMSGVFVGGILGHAAECAVDDSDLQPARLTVDLLRPAPMTPVRIRTKVVRRGRRLVLVEAEMTQSDDDTVIAKASGLFLRMGEQPPGTVWTAPVAMPPFPPEPDEPLDDTAMLLWTYGKHPDVATRGLDLTQWQHDGPKFVWLRHDKPLIDGEPTSVFTHVAMAGDVASSLTHFGTDGLYFINADYTVTLSRLPDGPDIGLAALTHSSHNGVATGTAAMFDRRGLIGTATATALSNPGFAPGTAG